MSQPQPALIGRYLIVIYHFILLFSAPVGPTKQPSSEEVQAKLAMHAEAMKQKAQVQAQAINMPQYLNPSVVNPQQYAAQQQKKKLLWSSKKTEVCF